MVDVAAPKVGFASLFGGANLMGVVLGFQVWSWGLGVPDASASFSARTGCPSLSFVTLSKRLRPGVLSRVPGALEPAVAKPLPKFDLGAKRLDPAWDALSVGPLAATLGSALGAASGVASSSDSPLSSSSAPLFFPEPVSDR